MLISFVPIFNKSIPDSMEVWQGAFLKSARSSLEKIRNLNPSRYVMLATDPIENDYRFFAVDRIQICDARKGKISLDDYLNIVKNPSKEPLYYLKDQCEDFRAFLNECAHFLNRQEGYSEQDLSIWYMNIKWFYELLKNDYDDFPDEIKMGIDQKQFSELSTLFSVLVYYFPKSLEESQTARSSMFKKLVSRLTIITGQI